MIKQWLEIAQLIGLIGGGLGFTIAGIGYSASIWSTWYGKKNKTTITNDTELLNYFKAKNDSYAEIVQDLQDQINELKADNIKLKTEGDEREKKMAEFKDIMAGRGPEDLKFREIVIQSTKDQIEYRQLSTRLFNQMITHLESLSKGDAEILRALIPSPVVTKS